MVDENNRLPEGPNLNEIPAAVIIPDDQGNNLRLGGENPNDLPAAAIVPNEQVNNLQLNDLVAYTNGER